MKSPYLNVESLIVNVSWLKSGLPKIAAINGVIRSVMKAFTRAVNARAMTSATATSSRLPFWIQALKSPHQLIPAPPDVERCRGESLRRGGRQGGPVAVALRDLLAEGGEAVGEAAVLDDEQVLRVLEAPAREVVAADERHVVGDHHLRVHVVVHGPGPVGGRALAGEARGDALPRPDLPAVGRHAAPLAAHLVHLRAIEGAGEVEAVPSGRLGDRAEHRAGGHDRREDPQAPPRLAGAGGDDVGERV